MDRSAASETGQTNVPLSEVASKRPLDRVLRAQTALWPKIRDKLEQDARLGNVERPRRALLANYDDRDFRSGVDSLGVVGGLILEIDLDVLDLVVGIGAWKSTRMSASAGLPSREGKTLKRREGRTTWFCGGDSPTSRSARVTRCAQGLHRREERGERADKAFRSSSMRRWRVGRESAEDAPDLGRVDGERDRGSHSSSLRSSKREGG